MPAGLICLQEVALWLKALQSAWARLKFDWTIRMVVLWILTGHSSGLAMPLNNGSWQTPDTVQHTVVYPDTTVLSIPVDTLPISTSDPDTVKLKTTLGRSPSVVLEHKVEYKSFEKIHFDLSNRKVFLYRDAEITYGKIRLKADYIAIDFNKNEVYATGLPDSAGVMRGTPVFADGDQEFQSTEITYNFETKKGLSRQVITKEGEGYIHGEKIKRLQDERINVSRGSYTTCDLPHPHFEFRYSRAQLIPRKLIVSGPAYMVIEGVAVPLFIPFGIFPNKTGQRSGIIIPRWGESQNRGFFFENLGYYWGINDYMDFKITGDIFTNGSWAVNPEFRYRKRYKYSGNFNFNYARNYFGDRESPDSRASTDFAIIWNHSQDPKARPNSRFSANVNIVTKRFNQFNLASTEAYLSNTFQSSISYQTHFNNAFFININALHQQNTIDGSVSVNLPTLSMNSRQLYPFRRKVPIGRQRWYENINIKYSSTLDNRLQTYDTLLFKPGWEQNFRSGMRHQIPVSFSTKLLRHFNLTNSLDYTERWYPYSIRKSWDPTWIITPTDTIFGRVVTDTVRHFATARDFSFSASVNTRLYGMYQFRGGPVSAIRHVVNPSVSFVLRPDFGSPFWGYWHDVQINPEGQTRRYSRFEGLLYGGPPDGRSGNLAFTLSNNLEAKIRSRADTAVVFKKIVLIDNLTLNISYDFARDSLNWSPLSISGRTTLFKQLYISYASTWDPYAVDAQGRPINQFEWKVNNRLFRMRNTTWNFSINYQLSQSSLQRKSSGTSRPTTLTTAGIGENSQAFPPQTNLPTNQDRFVNWNQPWNLNISLNVSFANNPRFVNQIWQDNRSKVIALGFNGDINLTPKWKVGMRSGYDFNSNQITYTTVDFYRDLHCWEMRFQWTPFGFRKSWIFGINVKSAILRDLKYERKKDFRDSL